jgi:hypothetical protein
MWIEGGAGQKSVVLFSVTYSIEASLLCVLGNTAGKKKL